jgi:hypothetical protein
MPLILTGAVSLVTGCGGSASSTTSSASPRRAFSSAAIRTAIARALPQARVGNASKGEVSISNPSAAPIDCKIPRYRGGGPFRVDDLSARTVRASDIDGEKLINQVTCQGKTIDGLNVTPEKDGEGVEYMADGTFRRSGYVYIHADLRPQYKDACRGTTRGGEDVPWATTAHGFCPGNFVGGTPPLSNTSGLSFWQEKEGEGLVITTAVGTSDFYVAHAGLRISCLVFNRTSDACYTNRDQIGKSPGTEGGPLSLDVYMGTSVTHAHLLLRGFCQKSDGACTPH